MSKEFINLDKMTTVYSFRITISDALKLKEGEPMTVEIKGLKFKIQKVN